MKFHYSFFHMTPQHSSRTPLTSRLCTLHIGLHLPVLREGLYAVSASPSVKDLFSFHGFPFGSYAMFCLVRRDQEQKLPYLSPLSPPGRRSFSLMPFPIFPSPEALFGVIRSAGLSVKVPLGSLFLGCLDIQFQGFSKRLLVAEDRCGQRKPE